MARHEASSVERLFSCLLGVFVCSQPPRGGADEDGAYACVSLLYYISIWCAGIFIHSFIHSFEWVLVGVGGDVRVVLTFDNHDVSEQVEKESVLLRKRLRVAVIFGVP